MTFWMDFSTFTVDISATTQGAKNIVTGLSGFALIASFIIGGWRPVSSRRGGLQEGMSEINDNMLRWPIFSIAVPAMFSGAMLVSDALADAIMNEFGGGVHNTVNLGGLQDTEFGPIVMLILALVTRVLIAPITAGLTPLFAALSFTEVGKQGLNHLVSFLIAAIATWEDEDDSGTLYDFFGYEEDEAAEGRRLINTLGLSAYDPRLSENNPPLESSSEWEKDYSSEVQARTNSDLKTYHSCRSPACRFREEQAELTM